MEGGIVVTLVWPALEEAVGSQPNRLPQGQRRAHRESDEWWGSFTLSGLPQGSLTRGKNCPGLALTQQVRPR